jgi:hypothetical protein
MESDARFNEKEYKRLREEAELRQKNREEYMQARFQEGKHPDTDPHFWDDFHEGAAPEVRSPGFFGMPNTRIWGSITFGLALFCLAPTLLAIFAIRWFLKRRRASRGL